MGQLENQMASRPRESGGSRASNRIDYQKDWAVCRLLELHETHDDYALVVERHDDVVVLDSPISPKRADFSQIKTKDSGVWTLSQLLRVEKSKAQPGKSAEKKMSVLAKMYCNRLVCEGQDITSSFVSNARFRLTLVDGEDGSNRTDIGFSELNPQDMGKIRLKLKEEHSLSDEPDCSSFMYLRVADLSLVDSSGHAKGKIADFLERQGGGEPVPVSAFYRVLFDHVKRKTNFEPEISDFRELLKRKAITKAEFQDILDKLPKPRSFETLRIEVSGQLRTEGMAASLIMSIFDDWKRHEVERMNRKNSTLIAMIHAANDAADSVKAEGLERGLREMIDVALARFGEQKIKGAELFKRSYCMAVILMRLYGY